MITVVDGLVINYWPTLELNMRKQTVEKCHFCFQTSETASKIYEKKILFR